MEEYINRNTKLRVEAKKSGNNFEVDFFKLMNNSVFGKTLENIRNRVGIRLISTDKVAQKLAANPNYDCCTIFDENFIAVHMKKTKLYFNNPVYFGMSILELSKSLMCDFHYNYIKTKYGDKAKLIFTDMTLSHMKLRPTIFTKISTPTLRNGLTLVTTQLIIHLELKQDLIVKCLECHESYTEEINKITLSSDDDKRVTMADGIHTLAYGHTNLKNCS